MRVIDSWICEVAASLVAPACSLPYAHVNHIRALANSPQPRAPEPFGLSTPGTKARGPLHVWRPLATPDGSGPRS